MAVEVDGGLDGLIDHERVAVRAMSAGESMGRVNSHTAARKAPSPPGSASRSLRAMLSDPSTFGAGRGAGVEHEGGNPSGR